MEKAFASSTRGEEFEHILTTLVEPPKAAYIGPFGHTLEVCPLRAGRRCFCDRDEPDMIKPLKSTGFGTEFVKQKEKGN